MKILHIIPSLDMGGAQSLVGEITSQLKSFPDTYVEILVFKESHSSIEHELKNKGIGIINLNSGSYLSIIFKLIKHIRQTDVVHVHLFPANYLVALANLWLQKPLVFTEHSTHNRRRNYRALRPVEKLMYSRYDYISCISSATADSLINWIGKDISEERIRIIENGIDLSKYKSREDIDCKEVFGKEGIPLIMISRFVPSKDHQTVIRALKVIDEKAFVVFVGDGKTKSEIMNLVNKYGLSNRVVFLGTRSDIPLLTHSAYIGIQSSNWEGFGITAIEMMASSLPVIASDVEGIREVVENAGLIFKKGDHRQLASLVNQLISDKEYYKQISMKCRARSEKYSIINTVEKYLNLYKNCCHN